MKKLLVILLSLMMLFGVFAATASAAGISFTDVKPSDWFYDDVKNAVNMGLVNGKSATTYAPDDNMTYAEATKLAACMYEKYTTGQVTLANSPTGNWYDSYVEYARANGIISGNYYWNGAASRAGYMAIFAHALPDSAFAQINNVPDNSIPDVGSYSYYGPDIYKLYRAGIVQGVDAQFNCKPDSNIKRSEVAAILTRMMDPAARKSFSTAPASALTITSQPKDAAITEGADAKFSVAVSGGTAPYAYEWHRVIKAQNNYDLKIVQDEPLITGTKTDTLTTKQCLADENGDQYYCVVTDAAGNKVTSQKATLTVSAAALTITKQPKNKTVNEGEDVSFSVEVSGGKEPYKYQWYKIYPGQTNAEIPTGGTYLNMTTATMTSRFNLPQYDDGAQYFCIITDADNNQVISNKVTLTVKAAAGPVTDLTISGPSSSTVGQTVTLKASVKGGQAPYEYTWQYLPPGGSWTVAIPETATCNLKPNTVGTWKFHCMVTDKNGSSVASNTLSVNVQKEVVTKTATKSGKVGESINTDYDFSWWDIPAGATSCDQSATTLTKYGLHCSWSGSRVTLYGTPTKSGKAFLRMLIETNSTIYHFDLTVNIEP